MAKKVKKAKLSDFEIAVMALEDAPISVEVQVGEQVFDIAVKQHIDEATRSAVIAQTEAMYFPLGQYDPNHGDAVLSFVLFQLYTGLAFNNDIDVFEKFKTTPMYDRIITFFSEECDLLERNVMHAAKMLCRKYNMPAAEENFFNSCGELVDALRTVMTTIEAMLNATAADVERNGSVAIKDMFDALQMVNKKDEKKLAKAILDFQEEKARVVKDESIPGIGVRKTK